MSLDRLHPARRAALEALYAVMRPPEDPTMGQIVDAVLDAAAPFLEVAGPPADPRPGAEAVALLNRADGLLGLTRHRGLGSDDWQWTRDADNLISDIRVFMRDTAKGGAA